MSADKSPSKSPTKDKAKPAAKASVTNKAKASVTNKAKAEPKTKTAAKIKAETPKTKTTAKVKAEPMSRVAVKSQGETKTKTATKAKAEPKARAAVKTKAEPKAQTAAKLKAEPKTRPASKAAPKAKTAAKKAPARDLAEVVAAAAAEHKPLDPVLLDLRGMSSVADWFFIASAENPRQMSAIADKIVRRAREHGYRPLGREGQGRSDERWVLLDMGEVVVHLFNLEGRELYDLDGLWTDAPRRVFKDGK